MSQRNNDGWKVNYTEDLGYIDPRDNPETLYADDVREMTDYGAGWRRHAASAEMAA